MLRQCGTSFDLFMQAMRYVAVSLLAVLSAICVFGAPQKNAKASSHFRKQPVSAAKLLKVTSSKPFSAGFVFVEGKYIPPPYKVERFGTVIRINGIQVTDPIVPWDEFLKTQALREVRADNAEGAVEPSEGEVESVDSAEEVVPDEPSVVEIGDVANIDDIDDLFETGREPVSTAVTAAVATPKKPVVRMKPVAPAMEIDGEFVMNEKAKALLARVNSVRKDIDAKLRKGGYVCFLSGCSGVTGDAPQARRLIETLPEVMKDHSDEAGFLQAAREAGLSYLPNRVLQGFCQNRIDYPMLMERRRAWAEGDKWKKALNDSDRSY